MHTFTDDDPWMRNLPVLLREGVAEFISLQGSEEIGVYQKRIVDWVPEDTQAPEVLWTQRHTGEGLGVDANFHVVGFRIGYRVGLPALRQLAEQGSVTEEAVAALPTVGFHEFWPMR